MIVPIASEICHPSTSHNTTVKNTSRISRANKKLHRGSLSGELLASVSQSILEIRYPLEVSHHRLYITSNSILPSFPVPSAGTGGNTWVKPWQSSVSDHAETPTRFTRYLHAGHIPFLEAAVYTLNIFSRLSAILSRCMNRVNPPCQSKISAFHLLHLLSH